MGQGTDGNGACPAMDTTVFQFADDPVEANWAHDKYYVCCV